MSDDTLTYELNISKNQFFRDYGMELQPSDPVDVEMQPSPSTSHSQNLPTPGSTSIASSSRSPSVQAGILYVPGTSPVATTSRSPSAQVPNLPVPDSGSIPTTPGSDLADADNALVGEPQETEHRPYQGLRIPSVLLSSRSTSEFSQLSGTLMGRNPEATSRKGRRFKLIYVPDPSRRSSSLFESQRNLGYALRTITADTYKILDQAVPGYVFRRPGGRSKEGRMKVHISEWLWVAVRLSTVLDGSMFQVTYMSWEKFRDGILTVDEDIVAELSRHDCLLGGIDYTIDYRSPATYGWKDSSEADRFAANLRTIRKVIIWPPAGELERAGWKFPIIDDLYAIATSLVPACPPITRGLCASDPIPPDTVLKRSHSDCSAHVIMPDASNKRTWPYLMSQAPTGEMWMAQQHMPMLSKFGEWRVFIVGGKIIQVVHTHRAGKGDWHASRVLTYWSLEELRAKIQNQGTTAADVVNPDQGTSTQRDRAKEEFENFTLETWKRLVLTEKVLANGSVSISIFCRLDIGLGMKDGRLMYFVNEVERSLTTSLWMNSMPDGVHGIFADTLASTLYDWLSGMMDPMHL
ncbi:hypothetical protein PISMIDRAFT_25228 [Pisolithus microcarpus 441]|uniref:Uncharacterized protein n=1 Tax=Pisolithus microcarpus 441 TaxID=765257 RepID=A0A0C9Z0E4_9AGAM|nr:hypothetical protein BKA83DRAFT_25228 [Pisolithus microcarpus]KIK15812.1 hypothetical protein PISMIDRAFT_25228 [Pisolithus microcarpus 441]